MTNRLLAAAAFLLFIFQALPAQHEPPPTQNLLKNPSFETFRSDLSSMGFGDPDKLQNKLPGWSLVGSSPVVCTREYADEVKPTSIICGEGKISIPDGRVMIEMEYNPHCNSPILERPGCSAYLGQQLEHPMKLSESYRLAARIYIPRSTDTRFAKYIGVQFYTDPVHWKANKFLDGHEFALDTVIFDQWYEVSWVVRPKCDLNFLVFGVFADLDGPPTYSLSRRINPDSRYFIDDLSLVRIERDESVGTVPFCRTVPKEKGPPVLSGTITYFASGSSEIEPDYRTELDSLAARMQRTPKAVFTIGGYTDPTGEDHLELANDRIDGVLGYLTAQHRISPLRFVRIPAGTDLEEGESVTAADYESMRRVSIRGISSTPQRVLYRHILLAIDAGRMRQAELWLTPYLVMATDRELRFVEHDPRLKGMLNRQPLRKLLEQRTGQRYTLQQRTAGVPFLDSLWREDQRSRTLGRYLENLQNYAESIDVDEDWWRVTYPGITNETAEQRDAIHLTLLLRWLKTNDWPVLSVAGKEAAKAPALILLHSADTTTMARYLPVLYDRCGKGEADWVYYAFLFDRNQTRRGLPQHYGTQYLNDENGKSQLLPVDNWDAMNQRREDMGIESLPRD